MITDIPISQARALLGRFRGDLGRGTVLELDIIDQIEDGNGDALLAHGCDIVIQRALEAAGVEFIPENGGGVGVRLRKAI